MGFYCEKHGNADPAVRYFAGVAAEAMGNASAARRSFEQAVERPHRRPEIRYYQGLAWRRTGLDGEAKRIFEGLLEHGRQLLESASAMD